MGVVGEGLVDFGDGGEGGGGKGGGENEQIYFGEQVMRMWLILEDRGTHDVAGQWRNGVLLQGILKDEANTLK